MCIVGSPPRSSDLARGCGSSFDNDRGDYQVRLHDHIAYRYEVLDFLGKGSFGQVLKCLDHKTGQVLALKIIRNKKRFHQQGAVEVKILRQITKNAHERTYAVNILDTFVFRSHLCITFPILSLNLYELIKANHFKGCPVRAVRRFAVQLARCLSFLKNQRIIHCDLKPENILLCQPNKSSIRVIDFGSACYEYERAYSYIQSRFYRSPEVILGLPYSTAIDMWSLGCVLFELLTGNPLFSGTNELDQLLCIMEIRGYPPRSMVESSTRRKIFFETNGSPKVDPDSKRPPRKPGSKSLSSLLKGHDTTLISFLDECLQWDPELRASPDQAIEHDWLRQSQSQLSPGNSITSTPPRLSPNNNDS